MFALTEIIDSSSAAGLLYFDSNMRRGISINNVKNKYEKLSFVPSNFCVIGVLLAPKKGASNKLM